MSALRSWVTEDALDEGRLALEHAPPEAVGGKPVCLTCRDCNSHAGRTVDAYMARRETAYDLLLGTMQRPRPARLEVGGAKMNVDYYHGAGGILVRGIPKANPPLAPDHLRAEMHKVIAPPAKIGFRVTPYRDRYRNDLARTGWLRSAYLLAFAVFGYLYVFKHRLGVLRRQLAEPGTTIIDPFGVVNPTADVHERHFLIVEEPPDLQGFAIQMGRNLVFLPWLVDGLYDHLAARYKVDPRFEERLRGRFVTWPREPLHLLDFDCIDGVEVTPT